MPRKKGALNEFIQEKKCSKCGKRFVPAVYHIYRKGKNGIARGLAITTGTMKTKILNSGVIV